MPTGTRSPRPLQGAGTDSEAVRPFKHSEVNPVSAVELGNTGLIHSVQGIERQRNEQNQAELLHFARLPWEPQEPLARPLQG